MSRNPKIRGVLAFTLVFTRTVVGLLISRRTPPATVKIYKTTTSALKWRVGCFL
ncbi:MAG: hypothetical protein OXN25_04085 [Candidatus Poribacteria bacterium]|nr:hypothetical protein [Candidatus Poribacteria bacterium]